MSFGTALTDVFGSVPKVAPYKKLNLTEEQKKSIGGNISNFADIAKLGEQFTQYMTAQQNQLLPGYSDTLALGQKGAQQLLSTGEGLLSGQIPQDVQDAVRRSSAYGALSGGFAGSGMARNLTARDFGLTSLDLMQRGAEMIGRGGNSAQQWAQLSSGDILNPGAFFVSPQQTAQFNMQNNILRQNYLQNKLNAEAAPSPAAAGISNTIMGLIGMAASYGMGGGAGMMGGGGMGGLEQGGKIGYQPSSLASGGGIFGTNSYGGSNLLGGW